MKTVYYNSETDDVITSKKQDYKLKIDYKWIHKNIFYTFLSYILYYIVLVIAFIYSKFFLHVTIKNRKVLKDTYFIYSNHTLTLGDVLNPFLISFPKRPYIICSPSNLGIPIIGHILPIVGALPIPDNIHDLQKLRDAINYHIEKKHPIYIYPEAHLWPYYTNIREYPKTSFHFPIENNAKTYVATTTYQKRKYGKKPKITIYVDGPILKNDKLSKKENITSIHAQVYKIMKENSLKSNYQYIEYKKKDCD